MSFRSKIFLVLALVGLAPLLVIGWLSFSLNRAELEKQVGGSQAALAQEAARGAERTLARAIESLRLSVAILPVFELEPAERPAALLIPYRQLDFVGAVALVGADGTLLAEPAFGPRKQQSDTAAPPLRPAKAARRHRRARHYQGREALPRSRAAPARARDGHRDERPLLGLGYQPRRGRAANRRGEAGRGGGGSLAVRAGPRHGGDRAGRPGRLRGNRGRHGDRRLSRRSLRGRAFPRSRH